VGVGDLVILVWAVGLLFLPGAAVLVALRGVSVITALAAAPAVTLGLLYVAALVGGATGLSYGLVLAAAVWALAVGSSLVLGRWSHRLPIWTVLPRSPMHLLGAVATVAAMATGLVLWIRGIGGLGAIPQEHDTVVHTELVAYVMRTGRAAPWQSLPADFLTGRPAGFYPNGFHLYAALVGSLGANAVVALNAAMVVLFAVALPAGVAALGLRLQPRAFAPLAGGCAAVLAAVSYHPLGILMHDGGILSNAAAFAIAPGVITLLLDVGRRRWVDVLPIALAIAAAVVVHPTSAVTVGLTTAAWLAASAVASRKNRGELRRHLGVLAVGAGAGAVLLVPFVLAASGVTTAAGNRLDSVVGFGRNVRVLSFLRSLGLAVSAPVGGLLDPRFASGQTWLTVLSIAGIAACLLLRRNAPVVAAFAAWTCFLTAFLADLPLPPVRAASGLYYNSYARISGGNALLQWLAAGLATAAVVELLVALVRRRFPARLPRARGPVLAGATVLVLVVVCLPYAHRDAEVLALRYQNPAYNRVDRYDLDAAAFVAKRIHAGQRVMNNANDGSTFGYVFYGVKVVVNQPLGGSAAPYTTELVRAFNRLDDDRHIHDLVCRLDIAWVIADDQAPRVGAPRTPWVIGGQYTTAPGLQHLERVPHVSQAARFGHVAVFTVDLAALGCPATPAR
jgi:hypothetical protein